MRGKGTRHGSQAAVHGITPAYAGKRQREDNGTTLIWDHPRVCGEKQNMLYCDGLP